MRRPLRALRHACVTIGLRAFIFWTIALGGPASTAWAQSQPPAAPPVEQVQYTQTVPSAAVAPVNPVRFRRVQIFPRSETGTSINFMQSPTGESVGVVTGGVNVVIQGLEVEGLPPIFGPLGNIDIETDRAVIWTSGVGPTGLAFDQSSDAPLEIYMEGNIVFRQGDRTVFAERMFYDVRRQVGVILNAELLTPLPQVGDYQYQGLVRLRAAAVRQLDASRFVASDAFVTTSRLEVPTYRVASDTVTFQDIQQPVIDPLTGQPVLDPITGEPRVAHQRLAQSRNNVLYLGEVPVFWWPTLATDLDKPSYYIDNLRVRNDSIFGTQLLLELDAYQLFGLPVTPEGTEWDINLDILSERGIGGGTTFEYGRDDLFGVRGPTNGLADLFVIDDDGLDNLGLGRRDIVPEEDFRGRLFWNHRQELMGGPLDRWTVQAEVGWISDRTFLEQYFEHEWDQNKDQITGVRIKRIFDNKVLSLEANTRVNDFFTQTQWLPRGDFYWLGESLLDDTLTFYNHAQAGYADIGIADFPSNPQLGAIFERLPWEETAGNIAVEAQGERLVTRQEFDLPLDVAPFKIVPYVLGEAAHWGADIEGNDIQRLYVQPGLRMSIPFWSVDPTVQSALFNLNGLAHKVVFEGEMFYADASQNIDQFPQYDPLDDDAIEEIRRRLFFAPFGGNLVGTYYIPGAPSFIDPKFDPRFYALRSGIQGVVTSPVTEIADDIYLTRFGMRHRWQTKRGVPGAQRIVDWLTLNTGATWFPRDERDNFGHPFGFFDYDLRWHVGDRVSVLSDGYADMFGDGLRTAAIGVLLNRPTRGNFYVGYRAIEGPNKANVVTATVNYRSTPKWVLSGSTSIDIDNTGNIGQNFLASRIGESLITTIGLSVDESKDNVGLNFLMEPRFLPRTSLTRRTGIDIPPAGAYGLE